MALNLHTTDWVTGGGGNNDASSVIVPVATNAVEGDLLVIQISTRASTTVTPPTGWTLLIQAAEVGPINWAATTYIYYRTASNSEPANYTFSFSSSRRWSYASGRISGHDSVSPFGTPADAASDTPLTLPGVTASAGNKLLSFIGISSTENQISTSVSVPIEMTSLVEVVKSSTAGVSLAVAHEDVSAGGATGTRAWSWSSTSEEAGSGVLVEVNAGAQNELTINITGSGSVTKDPDKAAYEDGEIVSLTAIPDSGNAFKKYTGDLVSREVIDTITMNADKIVGATFDNKAVWVSPDNNAQVGTTPTLRTRRTNE